MEIIFTGGMFLIIGALILLLFSIIFYVIAEIILNLEEVLKVIIVIALCVSIGGALYFVLG